MIKIKNYDKKNHKLSFITDMDVSLANAIRRSVLEIPVMAIDEVEIIKNDSALENERKQLVDEAKELVLIFASILRKCGAI